jgi:hypothetical protein
MIRVSLLPENDMRKRLCEFVLSALGAVMVLLYPFTLSTRHGR